MLRQILNHWRQHGFGRWAFIDKMNQKLVGHGGLEILENTCDVEVNYLLTRDFWNNGLATEAAHAIVQYGFDVLRLERLVAIAHPNNRASIRVMEKIGMHYDAEVYYHDVRWLRYVIDRDSVCRH
jgi:ribosomal-protein-alanine N-acetyltransferase